MLTKTSRRVMICNRAGHGVACDRCPRAKMHNCRGECMPFCCVQRGGSTKRVKCEPKKEKKNAGT